MHINYNYYNYKILVFFKFCFGSSKYLVKRTKYYYYVYSDPVMKQLLLHLDETLALGSKFVLANLDDCHLFVSQDVYDSLKVSV